VPQDGLWLKRKHRQKWALFGRQKGKCANCKTPMLLAFHHIQGEQPDNLATLQHAHDRFSDERGRHDGEYVNSLWCWKCNTADGAQSQAAQPLVELHRRAGNGVFGQNRHSQVADD
jgi:hypothetical protein